MYDRGEGLLSDEKRALHWFEVAGRDGNAVAAYEAGRRHEFGRGAGVDRGQAIEWYWRAARTGHREAMRALAATLSNWEVTKSSKRVDAYVWYKLAEEHGLSTRVERERLQAAMSERERQSAEARLDGERGNIERIKTWK